MSRHYVRRYAPDWADTQIEADYWDAELDQADYDRQDQRREAERDAADDVLLAKFRRIAGERP